MRPRTDLARWRSEKSGRQPTSFTSPSKPVAANRLPRDGDAGGETDTVLTFMSSHILTSLLDGVMAYTEVGDGGTSSDALLGIRRSAVGRRSTAGWSAAGSRTAAGSARATWRRCWFGADPLPARPVEALPLDVRKAAAPSVAAVCDPRTGEYPG